MTGEAKSRARQLGQAALLACAMLVVIAGSGLIGIIALGKEGSQELVYELAEPVYMCYRTLFPRPRGCSCTNVVDRMRSYCSAQTMYKRNDWDGDSTMEYAAPYATLCAQLDTDGTQIQLIDSAFAAATGSKGTPTHGYLFKDMKTIAGKPIDWTNDYAMCAIPAIYGRTGYRTFIVATDGTIYGKDIADGAFVDDYPADPTAAGWIIAE
jgi:Protein of unknown function (DUF2950)